MLGEFGRAVPVELVDIADSQSIQEDEWSLAVLEQEGVAQGFIDDIHGLLDGK